MAPKKKATKSRKRKSRNKGACWLLVISGIMMIFGGVINGPGIVGAISQLLLKTQVISNTYLVIFIAIIVWICAIFGLFGGFSVIFGAYLIHKNHIRIGKLVVGLGAGGGLFTLIIILVVALLWDILILIEYIWVITHSIGALGVLLSIYGRMKVK